MKILYLNHGGVGGGAILSLLYLIKAVDKNYFESLVCSTNEDPAVIELFSKHGFQTCSCKLPLFIHTNVRMFRLARIEGWRHLISWFCDYEAAKRRLGELIKKMKPDLVHFNSLTLAPYACVPFRMGIPTVIHVRECIANGMCGLRKMWLRHHLMQFATKVICISKDTFNCLGLPYGKTEVIYNAVDFNKFNCSIDKQLARQELMIPIEAKVTLFVGGSSPLAKGLYQYLEAMAAVLKKEKRLICLMPSFKFPPDPKNRKWNIRRRIGWLLGIYRKSDHLYKIIKRSGLYSRIINGEFTYNIERWIAASDVVCILHIKPHFSRTVIEAGAMKKPVVAFHVRGVEEIVKNNSTGLLLRNGDIKGLVRAMVKLLTDEALCERLGCGGYEQALRLFDINKHASKIEHIYKEVHGKKI